MTPCSLTTFFIIALAGVALFYVIASNPPVQSSTESCSYTAEDTNWGSAVNVQCGGRNLMSVPINNHDKPVSHLNLSSNVLKTLEEDALLGYESVRYLYLQYCKIVNINEKAFQKLENLTVIDLSSNRLNSISPNLFSGNQLLEKLILQNNRFGSLEWNTPILNGPPSLSSLDLQSCKLSNISSITFSLLPNLTFLDISRNKLVLLHNDTLSSHKQLNDVSLENNLWQCGAVFEGLLCWMHSNLSHSKNRIVQCQYKNGTWETWSAEYRSSLCDSDSTRSVTSLHGPDISTSTTLNPPRTSTHKPDISTSTTLNPPRTSTHEPDISTSTTLNPPRTSAHEPDISTITTLNPPRTSTHEPDISTSTTLNPPRTSAHESDIPTSTTPNPPSTSSHELDITTSTTLNPEVQLKEERAITILFWCLCVLLLLLPFLCFVYWRYRLRHSDENKALQNMYEETSALTSSSSSVDSGVNELR